MWWASQTIRGNYTFGRDRACGQPLHTRRYVLQDDLLNAHLTVEETLAYAAQLRLPRGLGEAEREARVEEVIAACELARCQGTVVGSPLRKGVSGGERKRLSVALELLCRPRLLFLDEPTSGLDAGEEGARAGANCECIAARPPPPPQTHTHAHDARSVSSLLLLLLLLLRSDRAQPDVQVAPAGRPACMRDRVHDPPALRQDLLTLFKAHPAAGACVACGLARVHATPPPQEQHNPPLAARLALHHHPLQPPHALAAAQDGGVVFQGPPAEAVAFFARHGFPCPQLTNPAGACGA